MQKKDDLYIKDLKKQADDIDLMIERMEEQIKSLSTSYKTEIEEIEVGSIPDRTLDQSREREREMEMERERENKTSLFKNKMETIKWTYFCNIFYLKARA